MVKKLWPNATITICGSFSTDLYLPTSDIDLQIFGNEVEVQSKFFVLKNELFATKTTEPHSIELRLNDTFPLCKFIDSQSKIYVGISFHDKRKRNIDAEQASMIQDYKRKYPALPKLVFVLKQFLIQHELRSYYKDN